MSLFGKKRRTMSDYLKIVIILVGVMAVCSAVALVAFNRTYLDSNGLYQNGAPGAVCVVLALVSLGICFCGYLIVPESTEVLSLPVARKRSLTVVSFVLAAEMVSIFIIYMLLGPLDVQYGTGHGIAGIPDLAEKMKTALLCYRFLVPLSIFAPIYFVVAALKNKIDPLFGSVTLIWTLVYIMRLYFDVTDWVMSVRKLTVICALCIFALFLVNEIRFAFSVGSFKKYFFFAAASAVFCISCGFAGVCSVFIKTYPLNYELPYYGSLLFVGIYALIRVFSFFPKALSHREKYDAYATENNDEGEDREI